MASKKNVREGGVLAFNRDAKGLILCERYSDCIMFELYLFASVSPNEFLGDKTKCSYFFQPIYFIIFKSHLTFNNFWIWRIFFTFLIIKLFCILYSCRKRISLKRWQHAKQSGKERIWVVVCVFHYRSKISGSVLTKKSGFWLPGRRPTYCSLQGKGFFPRYFQTCSEILLALSLEAKIQSVSMTILEFWNVWRLSNNVAFFQSGSCTSTILHGHTGCWYNFMQKKIVP